MDELLEIVMRDKGWRDELARKTYVAILGLMTPKPAAGASAAEAPKGKLRGHRQGGGGGVRPGGRRLSAQRLSMALF